MTFVRYSWCYRYLASLPGTYPPRCRMGRTCSFAFALALALLVGLQRGPAQEFSLTSRPLVLKGGLIRSQTEAGDFVGTVVLQGGKVVAVGTQVAIPPGATIVDASGCVITPGLIDGRSTLGLNAAAAREGGREANLDILDAVDPFSEEWRDAARQGVTAVYVQPAGTGNLGGAGAVLRVGPGTRAEELAIRPRAGVQAALGATPAAAPQTTIPTFQGRGGRGGLPTIPAPAAPAAPPASTTLTRYTQVEQLRAQFEAGRKYAEAPPARREAGRELLGRATRQEIPVFLETRHEDDLRHSLKLAADLNLRLVFERLDRMSGIPEEFRASRASLIVGPLTSGRVSAEVRRLALDGRRWILGTFGEDPRATAGLRLHAAAAVAGGYSRDRVLQAMTRDAADLLGVGERLGRIAAGRTADLVVFAGDPLDPSAPVRLTISQGVVTYQAPKAELAAQPWLAQATLPTKLPPRFVLKTTRLLRSNGEFGPGELRVAEGRIGNGGPNGANTPVVIDVGDAPVTPGLVAAHVAVGSERLPDADAGHLRTLDELSAEDARLRGYRDAGFVTALVAPGSANVVGGVVSSVRGANVAEAAETGIKFVLTSAARDNDRYPVSLAGQIELIGERLRGTPSTTDVYLPASVREALLGMRERGLQSVRDRRLTAMFEASTRAEVRAALRLTGDHRLRGVLVNPRQTGEVLEEIRTAGVGVIVGPQRPQDAEPTTQGVIALAKAGVPLAFGGETSDLRTSAAWLVNAGLPRAAARRALLAQPPEVFGLSTATARWTPGDPADFVVWDGDPLDTASRVLTVVVNGQSVARGPVQETAAGTDRRPATGGTKPRTRGRD